MQNITKCVKKAFSSVAMAANPEKLVGPPHFFINQRVA